MKKVFAYFYNRVYEKVIKPIVISVSPIREVALGMGIGMFVGLTPTVGIQMWIVFLIWLFAKYALNKRFDVIIGSAIVWISNPFTVIFIYYGFLKTGLLIFKILRIPAIELSYQVFYDQFSSILESSSGSFIDVVVKGTTFLLIDLGFPMLIGSLVYAIPLSIISYFLTKKLLLQYRIQKAQKMGMEYETWRKKYERAGFKGRKLKS